MNSPNEKFVLKRIRLLFWIIAALFFLNAATFPFMPLAVEKSNETNLWLFCVGAFFWITLLFACLLTIIASVYRKQLLYKKVVKKGLPGIISFFSNIPAIMFDTLFLLSLVAAVIIILFKKYNFYPVYILLSILLFSFYMHCMFNGRIYNSLHSKSARRFKK